MALQAGDTFGRYELVSWLGRGGMAETWHAQLVGAAGVTKSVLIKKVLPEYADDEAFISMFISEARISATLSHGNVAQVFDFGRVDGEYFLAMEFVDGQPLHRVLKRAMKSGLTALPIPVAVFIAMEMCRGLHYAHTRTDGSGAPLGIVHRDISPDNVLVGYEGQIKIVDFGIAKARLLRGFKTAPGVVKGKYLFFSPEQARGEEVDARTDVWATGVVLYELLCGRLPVDGPPHVVMMKVAHGEIPPLSELRPDLPAELNDIVLKALNPDQTQRFASSHAFGDALAGFLYSNFPRFSAMSIAHLLRVLFRGDLHQEGRELAVPDDFLVELKAWREPPAQLGTPTRRLRAVQTPPPSPVSVVTQDSQETVRPPPTDALNVPARSSLPLLARFALGGVALVALGGGLWWELSRPVAPMVRVAPAPEPKQQPPAEVKPQVVTKEEVLPPPKPTPTPPPTQTPTAPAPADNWDDARLARLMVEVDRLSKSKDLTRAARLVQTCVDALPRNADCRMTAGLTYERLRLYDKSALNYRAFLDVTPPTDPRRGAVSDRLKALPAAPRRSEPIPTTQTSVTPRATSSTELESLRSMTLQFMMQERWEDALGVATRCTTRLPQEPECYMLQGAVQAKLEQFQESTQSYERFLQLAPADHPKRTTVMKKLIENKMAASRN
ncbi:serine/threonine protein kinase [Corallococcus sp. CA053C]|uniref:serine/threonine-protein kinase n=1 Tax=Corallococcus sp. CA053C TaxID=2316732 RepID=UPI000EA014F3|nr:serine/threonine-protein kinase [Corallococcus sp. CA053C]RKH08485.1 serine/threonine protein kinase [Corallococcus sp. CA053C]